MFRLKSLPVPADYIVTNWGSDEHSFGAYSYARTGTTVLDVEALAAPEHDGRLYFAGEACSITGPQCVHGAVVTGNAAAVNILSLGNVDIRREQNRRRRRGHARGRGGELETVPQVWRLAQSSYGEHAGLWRAIACGNARTAAFGTRTSRKKGANIETSAKRRPCSQGGRRVRASSAPPPSWRRTS